MIFYYETNDEKSSEEKKFSNREKKRMQMKLRKLWPVFGLMCMGLFSTASAHPYSNHSQTGSMSSDSSSNQGTYQRGSTREITPDAGPRVVHGADVFITADFIWWKATQEGTDYATTGFQADTPADTLVNASRGHERTVGRDWAPGFKVGLGLNMSHDGWDIYAQYTWLRPSNSSSLSSDAVAPTSIIQTGDGPTVLGSRISAHWDLDFNVIDTELGRNFYLSQFLTMRPFIGLKATWQDQKLRSRITSRGTEGFVAGEDGNGNDIILEGPYKIHEKMDNWGIGVRGGFNIAWYMAKQWSIYGDLAWTAMWTDYTEISRKDTIENPTDVLGGGTATNINVRNNDHYAIKHILELELGLRWEIWFYDDNYHFAIQAGWEEQVWINWGTNFDLLTGQDWNDLSFHGLNLKFRFDF